MVNVYSLDGKVSGNVNLPAVFSTKPREDLVHRAVVAIQANRRQVYGPSEEAGMRSSAAYFGRRRDAYRMTINRGMSRLPREKLPDGSLGRVRLVPQSKGGRRAHPPKKKLWFKKVNAKEYGLALNSAISATAVKELVEKRGHLVDKVKEFPLIVEDKLEILKKTKDVLKTLRNLGVDQDVERVAVNGKGKTVLIVVNEDKGIGKGAGNISGVDVTTINELNPEQLAPGTHAGRLTLWTKSAITNLEKTKNGIKQSVALPANG